MEYAKAKENTFLSMDGKQYIDCTSQAWTLNVGHQHLIVTQTVKEQVDKMAFALGLYFEYIESLRLSPYVNSV